VCDLLADYTAIWSMIGCWHDTAVSLSVMKCIVAKQYNLQQKCLSRWIGSAL